MEPEKSSFLKNKPVAKKNSCRQFCRLAWVSVATPEMAHEKSPARTAGRR
jgi:hypothetical protein